MTAIKFTARKISDATTTTSQCTVLPLFSDGKVSGAAAALNKTWQMSVFTLESLKKMLTGLFSPKNLSGPITIAKVASASAKSGLESYIGFLALLSISLGVLNLLPIPVLDGGHLLFFSVEAIKGSPVSVKVREIAQQIGLFLLILLMILVFYNDITRIFFS